MSFFHRLITARVLFISAGQVVASVLRNRDLSLARVFKADEEGYEAFARYLEAPPHAPLYIVADLIEEDFRDEKVPHVRGADRKALLERRLSQFFHATPYRCARMQGRERTGRRDDMVLFSALTQNERLNPWIERIVAGKAPLAGISSSPLLSEFLAARMLNKDGPHLLLVSHHEHSGLRQTYLRNGRLKLSRLTPFVPAPGRNLPDPLPAVLVEECRLTRQYLERQRHIGYDQVLDIHVCAEPEDHGRLLHVNVGSPLLRVHVHDMDAVARSCGVKAATTDLGVFSSFLMQVRRSSWLPNHYAPAKILRYQRIRQMRLAMMFLGAVMIFASCCASFPLLFSGYKSFSQQQKLRDEALFFTANYQELRRNFPDVPVPAEVMRETVDTVERLRLLPSAADMAVRISRILDDFPEVRVNRFTWETAITPDNTHTPLSGNVRSVHAAAGDRPPQAELLSAMIEGRARATALLAGTIHPFTGQRATHDGLNRFVAALETIPGIRASLLEVPLETGSGARINTRLGKEASETAFLLQIKRTEP